MNNFFVNFCIVPGTVDNQFFFSFLNLFEEHELIEITEFDKRNYMIPGDWLLNPIDERVAEKMATAHGLDTDYYNEILDGRFLDSKSKEAIHKLIGAILVRFKLMCVKDDIFEYIWSNNVQRVEKVLGWITDRTDLPKIVLKSSRLALGKIKLEKISV